MDSFNTIAAFAIIVLVIGIGDYISQRTKGYISLLFTATILFIIMFATGMNKQLFELASFGKKAGWIAISLIITHLGTTLNIKTITAQWKTVILSVAVQIGLVAVLLFVVPFFFDWQTAIASVPACGGGIVAVIISQEAFEAHSMAYLSVFMVLLLSLKCLIGYPLASFMLRHEGRRLLLIRQSVPEQKTSVMLDNKAAWPFNPFVNFVFLPKLIRRRKLINFNFGLNIVVSCSAVVKQESVAITTKYARNIKDSCIIKSLLDTSS